MEYRDSKIINALLRLKRQPSDRSAPPTATALRSCPALLQRHVAGARLYADRHEMVRELMPGMRGTIAEIGVALGDFSEFLIETLLPKKFVAFDIFTMHQEPIIWGKPSHVLFSGMTHLEYYEQRFAGRNLTIEIGPSDERLETYKDGFFDFIYVDGGHSYECVANDARLSASKVKQDGVVIFNDYTMYDHITHSHYGVVPAVNELIVAGGWRVVGLALQRDMFCDLAIMRAP
jgi:hypothetical protein